MKATDHFKNTIKAYLDKQADKDILFSFRYSLPEKKLDDCITFILQQVQKSGCNGFHDDEILDMALSFYNNDNIEIGKPMDNVRVSVNHVVILTDEEKRQARQEAIQRVEKEEYDKMMKPKTKAKKVSLNVQQSLFDF